MKKILIQITIILVVSIVIGLGYNQMIQSPLPVFKRYVSDAKTDRATGEDLSVYYHEMDLETLEALKESDSILLLDARDPLLYEEGHIPGAISFPIAQFDEKYDSFIPLLKEGKTIVVYCIDPHCTDSSLLARELSNKGYEEIFAFKGGMEAWREMGKPVQTPEGIITFDATDAEENMEYSHENESH